MPTEIPIETVEKTALNGIQYFIENASGYVLKIIWAVAAFFVMLIVAKIIAKTVKKTIVRHSHGTEEQAIKIGKLMGNLAYYILLGFAVFVGFEILGFDVGLLLWWVSFGIWLAFKEILGNMIAGIMILYTKEFKLGDIVEVQADETYFGRIEEITIRYTIIRTLDLRQVVIPNLKMISVPIKTFSSEQIVKLGTTVGIHYKTDIERAINVIRAAVNNLNFVQEKENISVFVSDFGESSVQLLVKFFFDPNCWMIGDYAVGLVNEAIGKAFKANGIIIPYPHKTISFNSETEKEKFVSKIKKQDLSASN